MCWVDNANGRPAYDDRFAIQTSTGTLKAPIFSGSLTGNASTATKISYPAQLTTDDAINNFNEVNKFQVATWNNTSSPGVSNGIIISGGWASAAYGWQIAIDDDPTWYIALRQRGEDGWHAWKRIPMADGTGASGTWGISITGSATTATTASFITYTHNNEINFKGGRQSNCYFNYRCADDDSTSTAQACTYYFDSYGGNNYGSSKIYAGAIYGAVWNDYAEYRSAQSTEPGRVVREDNDGIMKLTTERLMPACEIISDTFGFAIGQADDCNTPIAAAGRVLAYPYEDRYSFELGQAVCSGPNGTVSKMTREEIMMYPERIIGTVSEIPEYETWGTGNVAVNGRIWIRIR